MKWDERYMDLAKAVSSWSKDPSRQIGAVAVSHQGSVLAQGYNGFPRGIEDSEIRYRDRDKKYKYIVHAEMNVIYNATYNGVCLDGATLYVYGLPVCGECAKGIIQVGIKRVVLRCDNVPDRWSESFKITQKMFEEAGIEWDFLSSSKT